MDPDWLPFHPNPSKPAFALPAGAVDAHCHVFGPAARFAFAPERKYTRLATRRRSSCLRCATPWVLRATSSSRPPATVTTTGRWSMRCCIRVGARGVAAVGRDVSDRALEQLHAAGVRGVRFNFVPRLVDFTPRNVLMEIADRIAPLGWHVVVYFEAQDLPQLWDFFTALRTPVVVDHMALPDVRQPVDGPQFERFVRLMREHPNIWSKVSCPERLSRSGPPGYDDVVPFARRIVETFPAACSGAPTGRTRT